MDTDADENQIPAPHPRTLFRLDKRTPYKADTSTFAYTGPKFPCSLDCPRHYGDHDNLNRDRACGDFDRCAAIAFTNPNDIGHRS